MCCADDVNVYMKFHEFICLIDHISLSLDFNKPIQNTPIIAFVVLSSSDHGHIHLHHHNLSNLFKYFPTFPSTLPTWPCSFDGLPSTDPVFCL